MAFAPGIFKKISKPKAITKNFFREVELVVQEAPQKALPEGSL
jgi:hypothetical protein